MNNGPNKRKKGSAKTRAPGSACRLVGSEAPFSKIVADRLAGPDPTYSLVPHIYYTLHLYNISLDHCVDDERFSKEFRNRVVDIATESDVLYNRNLDVQSLSNIWVYNLFLASRTMPTAAVWA